MFENGRLAWIQRNWGLFHENASSGEVATALFAAVGSAKAVSRAPAAVSTTVQRTPGLESKSVDFTFPSRRKITLQITEGGAKYGKQVTIDESVSTK